MWTAQMKNSVAALYKRSWTYSSHIPKLIFILFSRLIIDDPGRVDCTSVVYEVVHLVVENQQLQQDGSDRSTFALNSTAQLEKSASIKSRAEIIDVIHDLVCSALTTAHPGE